MDCIVHEVAKSQTQLSDFHALSFHYSCLGNPMDRGAWWATVNPWGHKELDMTERAHTHTHTQIHTHTHSPPSTKLRLSLDQVRNEIELDNKNG